MPSSPKKHKPMVFKPNKTERARRYDQDEHDRNLSSARWKKLRRLVLDHFPLCMDPFGGHESEGRIVAADEVHHIVRDEMLMFADRNLAPLCCPCHDKISGMERAGKQTEDLFPNRINL